MPSQKKTNPPEGQSLDAKSEELDYAIELLKSLSVIPEGEALIDINQRPTTRMIYTKGLTMWLLILQRLLGGQTLNGVVSHVVNHQMKLLPDNKRVREGKVSLNSGAFSQARKRISLEYILEISEKICHRLAELSSPFLDGRRVFILDGTTITLPPTSDLQTAFPPATNQHGESVWPVAMLMVAHELQSCCALLPQIDPMYGENNSSEVAQAAQIIKKLPKNSIVLADSGMGIYSVAHNSAAAGQNFLLSMTNSRFRSLRRAAKQIDEGPGYRTYHIHWTPSKDDRKSNPTLPAEASLEVLLHELDIGSTKKLRLVSSLQVNAQTAAEIYRRRYDVEFDIRDLKVTMDTENIRAKSVALVKKEIYASIVAYNLVVQFRRQAATVAKLPPRRLKFKATWTLFKDALLFQPSCSAKEWIQRFEKTLHVAATLKHPNRSKPRSYPRKAHTRRQKSTKFVKAEQRKRAAEQTSKPRK